MIEIILNTIFWTHAIYGFFEIIKNIINITKITVINRKIISVYIIFASPKSLIASPSSNIKILLNIITENIIDIKNIVYVFILFLKLLKAIESTLII